MLKFQYHPRGILLELVFIEDPINDVFFLEDGITVTFALRSATVCLSSTTSRRGPTRYFDGHQGRTYSCNCDVFTFFSTVSAIKK